MNPILGEFHQDAVIDIDLGDGHLLSYVGWNPDRDINPQYEGIPDIERCGATIYHLNPQGKPCQGFVHFDTPDVQRVFAGANMWTVMSWEPLTLTPSILCKSCYPPGAPPCGDHGFIENGKWRRA